jgi:hypothetical protein
MDGGVSWAEAGELGVHDFVAGIDGTSVVIGTRVGCSIQGPLHYRREPGHVPVEDLPLPNTLFWAYENVEGLGWTWVYPGFPSQLPGGEPVPPLPPASLSSLKGLSANGSDAETQYWRYARVYNDIVFLRTNSAGALTGAWHSPNEFLQLRTIVGPDLLIGTVLSEHPGDPDIRRHSERVPSIIELTPGLIHPIAGVAPGPGEPQVRLRRVVLD